MPHDFYRSPVADHILDDHLRRRGHSAATVDPLAARSIDLLRELLGIVEMAHDDAGVDRAVTRQVLHLIIYGAVPTREEIRARDELVGRLIEQAKTAPAPPFMVRLRP